MHGSRPPEFPAGIEDLKTAVSAAEEITDGKYFDIYSYPADIFPATFLHAATYHKDKSTGKEYIYIIGGLGDYRYTPHQWVTMAATMV